MRVLSTLLYHSIFDYPLTLAETHRHLISNKTVSLPTLKKEIDNLLKTGKIISTGGFFVPSSFVLRPSSLVSLRQRRKEISQKKLIIAKRASRLISIIPWVKMIAVTGALAMENADENDDIDLMVVASRNRLWIIRPLVMILISIFFRRRHPLSNAQTNNPPGRASGRRQQPTTNNNAICLNLWLDESALEIPVGQRNLYTAHELAQMKPVINRDGTYEKMMAKNFWGKKYLANAWKSFNRQIDKYPNRQIDKWNFISLPNRLAFYLQLRYMRPKMSNEKVSLHSAFFHPGNRADTILKAYDHICHRSF